MMICLAIRVRIIDLVSFSVSCFYECAVSESYNG
jgi:hypothetical protein